VQGAWEAS